MRDILSFLVPGAIVVFALLYLFGEGQNYIVNILKSVSSWIYLPLFGFCYVIGFALQCLGTDLFPVLKFHDKRCSKHKDKQCFWQRNCSLCYCEHLKVLKKFNELSEEIRGQHERFVVLKQMCGNNTLALSVVIIVIFVRILFRGYTYHSIGVIIVMLLLVWFLYIGYKSHLERQEMWEELVLKGDCRK